MGGADLVSVFLGAVLGFIVSVAGLWFRRNWERFDADQAQCRNELIELICSAEAARLAVRRERIRTEAAVLVMGSTSDVNQLVDRYAEAAEAVHEFSSRTRRLRCGSLRIVCASYAYLLRSFHWNVDDPPTADELDGAGQAVRNLIEEAIWRMDEQHTSSFALTGRPVHCPPEPLSSALPDHRS